MVGKAFLHSPSAFAFYIIFILKGDKDREQYGEYAYWC